MNLKDVGRRLREKATRAGFGIVVASFNAKNAGRDVLEEFVIDSLRSGAVAIVFIEVWRQHPALTAIAHKHGLEMIAERPVPGGRNRKIITEQGDTVALVAPAFGLVAHDFVVMSKHWTVNDTGREHEPRRLIRLLGHVKIRRARNLWRKKIHRFELLAAHGPTNTRQNAPAVAEFKARVIEILTNTRKDTTSAAVGDMNIRLDAARAWLKRLGIRVSGWGPDLSLVHGGRTRSRRRGKRGSDHYAMSHKIKPAKRKRYK